MDMMKLFYLKNPQILVDKINNMATSYTILVDQYPRYIGTLFAASPDMEDKIEQLVNELESSINMMEDPDIWALFDGETQDSLEAWIESTRNTIARERDEIANARKFLAKYNA